MENNPKSLSYKEFPSEPGELFPVYHVFKNIAGCYPLPTPYISEPAKVCVLGLMTDKGRPRLLLSNLSRQLQTLHIEGFPEGSKIQLIGDQEKSEFPEHSISAVPGETQIRMKSHDLVRVDM